MSTDHTILDADALDAGYKPFLVEGEETGQLSELVGRAGVRAGVYRVQPGEFPDRTPVPYFFETDEYIWVIEGEVHIEPIDGDRIILRPGDSAYFRRGSQSTWTFPRSLPEVLGRDRGRVVSARYDVAVIGGGFAGLAAAREVSFQGRSVVLVEAQERLGGRTWTTEGLGARIEMGGTDVHWLQPHVWTEVARYGLRIEEFTPPQQLLYLENGQVKEASDEVVFGLMAKGMDALAQASRQAWPRPHDPRFSDAAVQYDKLTLGEFLAGVEMSDAERAMTSSFWAAACQAPLDQAGLTLPLRWSALAGWDGS